jgi:hypothetical protein
MATTGTSGEPFRGVLDVAVEHEWTPYEAFPDVEYRVEDGRNAGIWLTDDEPGYVQPLGVLPEGP